MEKILKLTRVCENRMGDVVYKDEDGNCYLDISHSGVNPSELYCCSPIKDMDGEPGFPLKQKFEILNPFNERELRMRAFRGDYMMLSRLKDDCEAFFGKTGDKEKDKVDCRYCNEHNIWGQTIESHIKEMKRLWNVFPEDLKPEWCSWEDIKKFECLSSKR